MHLSTYWLVGSDNLMKAVEAVAVILAGTSLLQIKEKVQSPPEGTWVWGAVRAPKQLQYDERTALTGVCTVLRQDWGGSTQMGLWDSVKPSQRMDTRSGKHTWECILRRENRKLLLWK